MAEVAPLERARLYLQAGQPREAQTHLRAILAEAPADARAHLLLARAQSLLGDMAAAESHARAASADPELRALSYGALAEIVGLDVRRKAEAVDIAAAAVREAPDDWQLRGILARSLARTGDLANAWTQAESGVRLAPDDPTLRARALVDLARVPLADRRGGWRMLAIMHDAAALDPTDPEVMSMLALAQLHAGRRTDAITTSLGVLRSSPTEKLPATVARVAMHVIGARVSLILLGVAFLAPMAAGVASSAGMAVGARVGGAVGIAGIVLSIWLTVRSLTRIIDRRRLWALARTQSGLWGGGVVIGFALLVYALCLAFGVFVVPLPLFGCIWLVFIYWVSLYGQSTT